MGINLIGRERRGSDYLKTRKEKKEKKRRRGDNNTRAKFQSGKIRLEGE